MTVGLTRDGIFTYTLDTLTGTLNGSNRIFTIPENIVAGTEEVIVNGQVITRGVDYTISAATITLATNAYIPVAGDISFIQYPEHLFKNFPLYAR